VGNTQVCLAYFYCNSNFSQKDSTRDILGSILKQVLPQWSSYTGSPPLGFVLPLYEKYLEFNDGPELVQAFADILDRVATSLFCIYVVIDGLDEIVDRRQLLSVLKRLSAQSQKLRLLLVSRPEKDIERSFAGKNRLDIYEDCVEADIAAYIHWKMDYDEKLSPIKPSLKQEIKFQLLSQSGGM
jgi:hypothetical protein